MLESNVVAKRYDRGLKAPGLKALRKRAGLSQAELATRAGIGVTTVRRLETGHSGNFDTLDVLAAALSREMGERITRKMLLTPPPTDLKSLRRRTGLSQEALASRAKVDVHIVRRLEAGHANYFRDLEALASALSEELGETITRMMLLTSPPPDT